MTELRDDMFTSKIEQKFLIWYRRFFSIKEIEDSLLLKWAFGTLIFLHFIAFDNWFAKSATTIDAFLQGKHTCWPYFQSCGDWLFLRALPYGYSQGVWYMVLFGALALAVYLMYRKDWVLAHMALLPTFVWHTLGTFVITQSLAGNYEYFVFLYSLVILLIPHKEFFLKLTIVFAYFMPATIKLHEGWVLGTYFSALKTGMPLVSDWAIPIFTNVVIFTQVIGAWFLISRNWVLQRSALVFFILFHIYSGILVGFRYPATALPMVLIASGPLYRYLPIPFGRRTIAGWFIVVFMVVVQFISVVTPGDTKMTMEGNMYGFYMFEANHQCVSTATAYRVDGSKKIFKENSFSARRRCDPYRFAFSLKEQCSRAGDGLERVGWTFDHSINGGLFFRIVDVQDVCDLKLNALGHNPWIKLKSDNPAVIGTAAENVYW